MKRLFLGLLAVTALGACGGRPERWNAKVTLPLQTQGLSESVAIVDTELDRVLMLTASSDRSLREKPVQVGKNVVKTEISHDRQTLFVLSKGIQPRRNPDDERPSLTVIDGRLDPGATVHYSLTDPLTGLAVDPEGEWVVVYDAGGVVVNPNELIFVRVGDPNFAPFSKTIRSFGGRPTRLSFTRELSVPNGEPRRFAVVETEQDVTLVDLSDLNREEVTLILPKTPSGKPGSPAEVDFHDGVADDPTDARIAIRLTNDSNVMLVELGPPGPGEADKAFKPTVNVADVGGVPTSIAFVQTDGGLRLAALVPSTSCPDSLGSCPSAALVDPATTVVEMVALDKPYTQLTRITNDVSDKPATSDVALLWSDQATGIAFWSLGKTSNTPFRSVDPYDIGIAVSSVKSVPSEKFAHLKILESTGSTEFYVLDLDKRESAPMITNASGFELTVAPDGQRAWALRKGTKQFASIDLSDLHPTSVEVERTVYAVYDIERRDGGRAAIALHVNESNDRVAVGATVLDALDPDTAQSRFYSSLMLGGF